MASVQTGFDFSTSFFGETFLRELHRSVTFLLGGYTISFNSSIFVDSNCAYLQQSEAIMHGTTADVIIKLYCIHRRVKQAIIKQYPNHSTLPYNPPMIQTILEFKHDEYPFSIRDNHINLKLELLIDCADSAEFIQQKKKYQTLKSLTIIPHCIKIMQIYQESLRIHLIYEYVHHSLKEYIQHQLDLQDGNSLQDAKKDILRNVAGELATLTNQLLNSHILTHLQYRNIGVRDADDKTQQQNAIVLKYYIGTEFQFSQFPKEKLLQFYLCERRKILTILEQELQLGQRADSLPNFILRQNRLFFTDELSETKTKKKKGESPGRQRQRFDQSMEDNLFRGRRRQERQGRSSAKPKKHKYSCNFEEQNLHFQAQNQPMNRSFEDDNENYSITKTKSMKIEMQHQKATKKNRKNSLKFKITTFQQISIDQSVDEGEHENQNEQYQRQRYSYAPEPDTRAGQEKKDYRQKVNEAKIRAQALLNKYLKTKNRPGYK